MNIFNRRNKFDNNPTSRKMKELAKKAVDYAKHFKYNFDFKRESVTELEIVLENYEKATKTVHSSDREIWELAMIFGAYLGEVMLDTGLRKAGFYWAETDSVPFLRKDDKTNVSPVTKVFKRLKNGSEDNIEPFFDIALCIAKNRKQRKSNNH